MEINNSQSYWFVVREDQSNVIFSSNNFTIQTPQVTGQETRYVIDDSADNRQYSHNVHVEPLPELQDESVKESKELTFWDRNRIKQLLSLCLENRYKSGNKMLWNEISILLGTTPEECDKKYRNLRRTYIRLFKKNRAGNEIKWVHYNMCDEVYKDCKSMSMAMLPPWEDSKVRKLLTLYIDNLNKFRSPEHLQKDIWRDIASQLNTTEYNCYHKFKNMKRTYFNWIERSRESGKLRKWPYHHYFERIYYNYSPDLGPWDRNKIRQLIIAYSEIAYKFRNPKYQKKELWREIANKIGESPSNCDRKFRNLKQTYIRLKMRVNTGRSLTKWRYFKDFAKIFEHEAFLMLNEDEVLESYKDVSPRAERDYIIQLLTFYLENKQKFNDPLVKKKHLWRQIGPRLGLTAEECDKKFRNMKQTYIRLAEKKRDTGKDNSWPYYAYFEEIFDGNKMFRKECSHKCSIDNTTITEISNFVKNNEIKDKDKFEKLISAIEDSNNIQKERNRILQALLNRK